MFVLQLFYTLPPQGVGKREDLLIGEHLQVINLSLLVVPGLQEGGGSMFHSSSSIWQRFSAENTG